VKLLDTFFQNARAGERLWAGDGGDDERVPGIQHGHEKWQHNVEKFTS